MLLPRLLLTRISGGQQKQLRAIFGSLQELACLQQIDVSEEEGG